MSNILLMSCIHEKNCIDTIPSKKKLNQINKRNVSWCLSKRKYDIELWYMFVVEE